MENRIEKQEFIQDNKNSNKKNSRVNVKKKNGPVILWKSFVEFFFREIIASNIYMKEISPHPRDPFKLDNLLAIYYYLIVSWMQANHNHLSNIISPAIEFKLDQLR